MLARAPFRDVVGGVSLGMRCGRRGNGPDVAYPRPRCLVSCARTLRWRSLGAGVSNVPCQHISDDSLNQLVRLSCPYLGVCGVVTSFMGALPFSLAVRRLSSGEVVDVGVVEAVEGVS